MTANRKEERKAHEAELYTGMEKDREERECKENKNTEK